MDFGRPHLLEESVASRSLVRYISQEEGLRLLRRQCSGNSDNKNNGNHHDDTTTIISQSHEPDEVARDHENGPKTSTAQEVTTEEKKTKNEDYDDDDLKLDLMTLKAANHAAMSLLVPKSAIATSGGQVATTSMTGDDSPMNTTAQPQDSTTLTRTTTIPDCLIDASLYQHRCLPEQPTIQVGDLVVIMISFDTLSFVYATRNAIFSNRRGHFHHNDFLGQPFGCKIRSRNNQGYGFCYLLKPTPELWIRSLPHRTQIVHELDQAQILFQLHLKPNSIVVESGTGSGALSHALIRAIAPHGQLHTYEFNPHRAQTAREEFSRHGLSHLVTVRNVDVCVTGTVTTTNGDGDEGPEVGGCSGSGGFVGLSAQSVDAVFLDLPEPWNAIPHAAHVLKANGRLANYSPCIEQTQRVVIALEEAGFHSIQTMEYRLLEYYVDEVTQEPPPWNLPRPCTVDVQYDPAAAAVKVQQQQRLLQLDEDNDEPADKPKSNKKNKKKRRNSSRSAPQVNPVAQEGGNAASSAPSPRFKKQKLKKHEEAKSSKTHHNIHGNDDDDKDDDPVGQSRNGRGNKSKTMLVARRLERFEVIQPF